MAVTSLGQILVVLVISVWVHPEKQSGFVDNRHRNAQTTAHPFGEILGLYVALFPQVEGFLQFLGTFRPLTARHTIDAGGEHQVVPNGQFSVDVGFFGDQPGLPFGGI